MDDIPLWELLAVCVGLIVSFFFSATETALTSLTEARTQQLLEESKNPKNPLRHWLEAPERILTTLLFGNNLANIGISALTTSIALRLAPNTSGAVAVATGITTFVILTFCEITPKTLARRHAVAFAEAAIPVIVVLSWIFYPINHCLVALSNGLTWLLNGGKQQEEQPKVTGDEIEYLIELGGREGVLDDVKQQLLTSVLEFSDIVVKEIMVPRTQMIGLEKGASFDEVMTLFEESEHSRIPVYDESIDNIVGVFYIKDVACDLHQGLDPETFQLSKYVRPAFFVPELMKISRLLREFQKRKMHLAVVVDEFGGTSGLATLEDVVEEIVGEIQDELDAEETLIQPLPDGRFAVDGSAPLRQVEEALDVEFPEEGDYETLGGFVTALSGRVPPIGTRLSWEKLCFIVRAADERHVSKVEISRADGSEKPSPSAASEPSAESDLASASASSSDVALDSAPASVSVDATSPVPLLSGTSASEPPSA
ncbi:MAG: hemolysin family protein [Myxococcales bacterium]|nr:hemolysin family protein [Myxococcales bacterium]